MRRKQLKEKFKFCCGCGACSRTGDELETSDARRAELKRLDHDVYDAIARGRYEEGEKAIERTMELLRLEKLDFPATIARVAYDAYQGATYAKNAFRQKKWLTIMLENQRLSDRPDGEEVRNLEAALKSLA